FIEPATTSSSASCSIVSPESLIGAAARLGTAGTACPFGGGVFDGAERGAIPGTGVGLALGAALMSATDGTAGTRGTLGGDDAFMTLGGGADGFATPGALPGAPAVAAFAGAPGIAALATVGGGPGTVLAADVPSAGVEPFAGAPAPGARPEPLSGGWAIR
ncbi:MAG: hypothetical protein ACT4TC_21605, partial [Myxococcaceae bacterium]